MCNETLIGGGGLDVYLGGGGVRGRGHDPKTYMSVHLYIGQLMLKLNI